MNYLQQQNICKMVESTARRFSFGNIADREDIEQELRIKVWKTTKPGLSEAQIQTRLTNHAIDIARRNMKYVNRCLICGDDTEINDQQEKDTRVGSADAFSSTAIVDLQVDLAQMFDAVRKSFVEDVRIIKMLDLLNEEPKLTNKAVGAAIGVSDRTILNFKRKIIAFIRSNFPNYSEFAS